MCLLTAISEQTIFLWTFIARQIAHTLEDIEEAEDTIGPPNASRQGSFFDSSVPTAAEQHKLSIEQEEMIKKAFQLFDSDGGGQMEEQELAGALFAMGFSTIHHHKMAKKLIGKYNGSLSIDSFTELMAGQLAGQNPEQKIRATFNKLCGSNPKVQTVNLQQLKAKVKELKIKLSDQEMISMISDVARSNKGEVDVEEFVHVLKKSTWT